MSFSDTVVQGEAIESDIESDIDVVFNVHAKNQKVSEIRFQARRTFSSELTF